MDRSEEGSLTSASFPLPIATELFNKLKVVSIFGYNDLRVPHASGRTKEGEENKTGPEDDNDEVEWRDGEADIGVEEDNGVCGLLSASNDGVKCKFA
jgi:hypothetical protein